MRAIQLAAVLVVASAPAHGQTACPAPGAAIPAYAPAPVTALADPTVTPSAAAPAVDPAPSPLPTPPPVPPATPPQTAAATLPATPAAPQLPGLDAPASQPADGVDGEPPSPLYPAGTPYPAGVPLPSTGGLGFSNTDNSLDGQPMSGGALQ